MGTKTFHNSDASGAKTNVPDIEFFGNGDTFKLLCKASSKSEGWMKSTKAMEIPGVGCVVQVTTQQGDQIAEALTFVPGVKISGDGSKEHGRFLIIQRSLLFQNLWPCRLLRSALLYEFSQDVSKSRLNEYSLLFTTTVSFCSHCVTCGGSTPCFSANRR